MRWWLLASIVLALLVVPCVEAAPELPRPRQLSVADGLPSNRVSGMVEDRDGYLWISTADGLARYDGTGFQVWRVEDGLPDARLWSIAIDSHGVIWLGTALAGLVSYDPASNSFSTPAGVGAPDIEGKQVWTVAVDAADNVWFGTAGGGLYRRDAEGRVDRFLPVEGDERSLPSEAVNVVSIAPDGSVWVGTRNGVARWTGSDFERLPRSALPDERVNGFSFGSDGTLWIGTAGGLAVRHPDGTVERAGWGQDIERNVIEVLLQDRRGNYWLDIRAGLGFADSALGAVGVVPLYSDATRDEVRPYWAGAHEDREGGVWLLSNSHALWYVPAAWRRFVIHSRRIGDPSTLGNAAVRGMAPASGGGMWLVGSSGVLERFDPATGQVMRLKEDVGQGVVLSQVFEDSRGQVWVGYMAGLARVDPRTGAVRRWGVEQDADAIPARLEARGFIELDGHLWLVIGHTHVQVRQLDGRVVGAFVTGDGSGLDEGESLYDLVVGPDGRPWLGTSRGLRRLTADGNGWEPVPGSGGDVAEAMAVLGDRVWASRTGRLDGWRWEEGRLQHVLALGPDDGLPMVASSGIVLDPGGSLWLASTRGLIRIHPGTGAVRTWAVGDGLPSQDMRHPPARDPHSGLILAGTPDGLVVFDPALLERAGRTPNLVVSRVQVRGQAPFVPDGPFELRHSDRDLRVAARLLSFRNPSANLYRFRLLGYDDGWVDAGAGGERVFTQLPVGDWRLEVAARNADGLWSEVRTLQFRIAPPWWRTPGAMLGFVLCGLALLWAGAHLYRRRLDRRHAWQLAEHKRQLAEQSSLAKSRFLATMGHEVRTPMTGILGMSELLLGTELLGAQRRYAESIRTAGEHLLRLLDDALDLARIEAGKLHLDSQPFDLRKLLEEVAGLTAPIAAQRGLQFRQHIAEDLPVWVLGDVVRVRQILLNLLGNAVKFTERGHVELRAERGAGNVVRFEVVDTGPGLNAEQRERLFRRFEQAEGPQHTARYGGSGLGLAICQELSAGMGGRITVDSGLGRGTRFEVELPLPATRPVSAATDAAQAARARPLSLLLVEDDPTVAEVIGGLLRSQGHSVTHAAHGLAALTALAAGTPDAAMLDLDLPGLDGFALARQLRAQGFEGTLIALTARADAEVEALAFGAGFNRFVRKPLTGAILSRALAGVGPAD